MLLSFRIPAKQYERFAPDAAESMIGQEFTAKIEDTPLGLGIVLDAKVIENGSAIEIKVEWPD